MQRSANEENVAEPRSSMEKAEHNPREGGAPDREEPRGIESGGLQVAITAFVVLFCIVGLALWGLPFYYDFMVQQFGWTRAQVTSGNALSKLVVGPVFGFIAGWIIDRFGPRRVMIAGILMAGGALVGLGWVSTLGMFYLFYFFNALGYVCGGPLPNQVLLSRWFDKSRGKAMGFAYLGIGIGGATVPWISHALIEHFGWQAALRWLGVLIIVVSLPLALFVKEAPLLLASERKMPGTADVLARLQNSSVLPAHFRQHVFDRRSQRHPAESQTLSEPRPAFHTKRRGASSVTGAFV